MNPDYSISTRHSLLCRLKNSDDDKSWQDFFNTYWRLIYGVAIKAGLTEDEAQDVVQETIISLARSMPGFKYDPAKCSFKTWLLNMTRWRIVDQIRKRQTGAASNASPWRVLTDADSLEEIADPAGIELETIWNEEWQANLLEAAAERVKRQVKPKQYQMFYLHVLRELPVHEVAKRVAASVGQVYLAKHRVGRLLRKEMEILATRMV